jgi:MFS transporter, FHS family, glucose/mannose:H+ symporter
MPGSRLCRGTPTPPAYPPFAGYHVALRRQRCAAPRAKSSESQTMDSMVATVNPNPLLGPMLIVALLASGMGVALLGSIKVPLAARLRIDEARVGGLVSLFGFTLIPVFLTAGFLTDLVGRQVVLVSGSVLFAASLGLLARARTYPLALMAVVLMSTGWAFATNVGNVLTPLAFPGNMSYATNLANVFFGLGALITPLATAFLVHRTTLGWTLIVFAGLAILPALLSLGVDFAAIAPANPTGGAAASQTSTLWRDPIMWLCGFALFFYGPLEASLGAWTTTYLGEQGYREPTAAGLLSGFWLSFMAARLITAFTLPSGREGPLLVVLSLAAVAVLGAMALAHGRTQSGALVLAAGAVFGPIFPTLLAILLGHFAPALQGRAVGMLFAIGGIGWTAIPILLGAAAHRWGVRRALGIAVAAAAGLFGITLALAFQ